MCDSCGCSDVEHGAQVHTHDHEHHGDHRHGVRTTIELEHDLLARSNRIAEKNRRWLADRNIVALNLVSSPGAGKTTLLERTIRDWAGVAPIYVIEGDQATSFDAERIRAAGCAAIQINTGAGCHLDAEMLTRAIAELNPRPGALVFVENVGNLVCPALFDLGESAKVLVSSVTEGDDKPLKYPFMFRASELMLLNKIDLLPHVSFDVERCVGFARRVRPGIEAIQISATRGDGLKQWYGWLRDRIAAPAAFSGSLR